MVVPIQILYNNPRQMTNLFVIDWFENETATVIEARNSILSISMREEKFKQCIIQPKFNRSFEMGKYLGKGAYGSVHIGHRVLKLARD